MPPVVIAAGITAAGAIGSAVANRSAQKRATDVGLQANREAMAYQREQDAKREAAMQAYQANREALLRRYGVDIGQGAPPVAVASVPAGAAGPARPIQSATGRVPGRSLPVGATMDDLIREPGAWNDWSTYGLRRG